MAVRTMSMRTRAAEGTLAAAMDVAVEVSLEIWRRNDKVTNDISFRDQTFRELIIVENSCLMTLIYNMYYVVLQQFCIVI